MQRWTPTLEINANTKIAKDSRKNGHMEGRTYYTATQGILPCGLRPHDMHEITGCALLLPKIDAEDWTEIQRDRGTDI